MRSKPVLNLVNVAVHHVAAPTGAVGREGAAPVNSPSCEAAAGTTSKALFAFRRDTTTTEIPYASAMSDSAPHANLSFSENFKILSEGDSHEENLAQCVYLPADFFDFPECTSFVSSGIRPEAAPHTRWKAYKGRPGKPARLDLPRCKERSRQNRKLGIGDSEPLRGQTKRL